MFVKQKGRTELGQDYQPNIILIMADQLAPMFLGCYGSETAKTPQLDKLARNGVRFDAAYSPNPLCAPARASLMTGRHASSIGAYDNAALLPADIPTVAHYLTNAGYECILSGKMHFVGPDQLHGYKKRLTSNIYPADFSWTRSRNWEGKTMLVPDRLGPAYLKADEHNPMGIGVMKRGYHFEFDEQTHSRSLEFIRRYRTGKQYVDYALPKEDTVRKPFFLTVSYHHPHQPWHVPRKYWDMYEGVDIPVPDIPKDMDQHMSQLDKWLYVFHGLDKIDITDRENLRLLHRGYYSMISYIDNLVGELVAELEEQQLTDNTVIMFTSDHGDMLGNKNMIQKRSFYEQSARVPLIINFPDSRSGGKRIDAPVSLIDILPTCTDLAGYPKDLIAPIDGTSLLPFVEDDNSEKDRIIFSESHSEGAYAPCFMARQGKYKYIYIHGYDPQLFDLEADPGEWNNLSGSEEPADIESNLKSGVLERFDPDRIEADLRRNIEWRHIIDAAMKLNGTSWDHTVVEDGRYLFLRQSAPSEEAAARILKR